MLGHDRVAALRVLDGDLDGRLRIEMDGYESTTLFATMPLGSIPATVTLDAPAGALDVVLQA